MNVLFSHITQAAAATVINVVIVFLQFTLALSLVALLLYFIPPVNSALAWNVIGRSLHASLWPTILRTDSTAARGTGFRVAIFSYLSFVVTALVAVAGVLMPLGLSGGPVLLAPPKRVAASFVADTSPLGLATSPRGNFVSSRTCGMTGLLVCPGNSGSNTSLIAPDVVARFNSTPHGAFAMEFRRYYDTSVSIRANNYSHTMSFSQFSTTESLILRDGIFAVGGLVVDMDNPGIGLWNHTLPVETPHGGVWSADVLWLEPVSACVDTNLTFDYMLSPDTSRNLVENFNLTDRGGFFNLTHEYPEFDRNGQNIDLRQHAYKGAVLSNFAAMKFFNNMTQNESHYGRTFQLNFTNTHIVAGKMRVANLWYLDSGIDDGAGLGSDVDLLCKGYGGGDTANITNVAVHCNILLAPPQRSDGGDPLFPSDNSTWTQRLLSCASTTRVRMQHVQFSFNGTMDLAALSISRNNVDTPVLWATEKSELNITDVDLLWGRVSDSLEGDPSLWTIRSDVFYIPAGGIDYWGPSDSSQTSTLPSQAWNSVRPDYSGISGVMDYTGLSSFALLNKFHTLISANPQHGASQILNLIWTDLMANNALGTDSSSRLLVQLNVPSIAYDLRFAVPALLLFGLWIPAFSGAVFVLVTGMLRFSYVRHLLYHTGAGRIALGNSALKPMYPDQSAHSEATADLGMPLPSEDEKDWAKGAGRTPVCIQPPKRDHNVPYSGDSTEFFPLPTHEK